MRGQFPLMLVVGVDTLKGRRAWVVLRRLDVKTPVAKTQHPTPDEGIDSSSAVA